MNALTIDIAASPAAVWEEIRDITSHAEWMADAASVVITSDQREGVGTTATCITRVGPLHVTDEMVVVVWEPQHEMTIRHVGAVTGTGSFVLTPSASGTTFAWSEALTFPWWLGGSIGKFVGGKVLRTIWRRNLQALKQRIETT